MVIILVENKRFQNYPEIVIFWWRKIDSK